MFGVGRLRQSSNDPVEVVILCLIWAEQRLAKRPFSDQVFGFDEQVGGFQVGLFQRIPKQAQPNRGPFNTSVGHRVTGQRSTLTSNRSSNLAPGYRLPKIGSKQNEARAIFVPA